MITEALGTGKNDNTDSRFCFFQNKPILYLYKTPFAYKKYSCTAKVKYKRSLLYMKATGIVRRIDDLGRVVIPKEIRRTMRIREGDPLEIFTDRDGEVIFKKYSPIGELVNFASQYADTLHKTCTNPIIICDRDSVVAFAGVSKKECAEKKVSWKTVRFIAMRPAKKNSISWTAMKRSHYPALCRSLPKEMLSAQWPPF